MSKYFITFFFLIIFPISLKADDFFIAEPKRISFFYYIGFLKMEGFLKISENFFKINFEEPEKSEVFLTIDVENSDAGFPLATLIMKGKKVLDTQNYPLGYFESVKIKKYKNVFVILGNLTLRGRKKKAEIRIVLKNKNKNILNFKIDGMFDRFDFGANGYENIVGNIIYLKSEVKLIIKES